MPQPNEMPRTPSIKGLGKPLEASNAPGKLYLLCSAGTAVFCGLFLQSYALSGLIIGAALVDALAGLMSRNLFCPPFHLRTSPDEGLHQDREKICPYWPEETILGPKAMKLEFTDVEMPISTHCLLRGWLIPPQGHKEDHKTVLIMSHGAGRDRRAWLRHIPFLTKAGYTCLTFDFRSHGTSDVFGGGGTFLGAVEWEDVHAAAEWAKTNCPGLKAVFMGTSTGAVASAIAMSKKPWLGEYIACIVAENPFSSVAALTDFVVSNVGFRVVLCKGNQLAYTLLYPLCVLVAFATNIKVRRHIRGVITDPVPSALDVVDKVRRPPPPLFCRHGQHTELSHAIVNGESTRQIAAPLLVMHGTNDQIVPTSHSEEIIARCKRGPHADTLESWICPGGGHCQLWDTDRGEFESRVIAFLNRHCAS